MRAFLEMFLVLEEESELLVKKSTPAAPPSPHISKSFRRIRIFLLLAALPPLVAQTVGITVFYRLNKGQQFEVIAGHSMQLAV